MVEPDDCAIKKNKLLEKIKVMASYCVTHIHWACTYGSICYMEFGTNVVVLKHIPVRLYEFSHLLEFGTNVVGIKHIPVMLYEASHPQDVESTMNYMDSL